MDALKGGVGGKGDRGSRITLIGEWESERRLYRGIEG